MTSKPPYEKAIGAFNDSERPPALAVPSPARRATVSEPKYIERMQCDNEPIWLFEASTTFMAGVLVIIGVNVLLSLILRHFRDAVESAMLFWFLATIRWYQRRGGRQ